MAHFFLKGHECNKPGCSKVLVIDGNMKTCRQVCAVKDITTLLFKTTDIEVTTGCMNTPSKGFEVCDEHIETTAPFVDSSSDEKEKESLATKEYEGVMKILEIKETRTSKMYKV